jgi:FAD/FMN-containing dehydrogenase
MSESLGQSMHVLQAIKNTLDPTDIFNPGKLGLSTSRAGTIWP